MSIGVSGDGVDRLVVGERRSVEGRADDGHRRRSGLCPVAVVDGVAERTGAAPCAAVDARAGGHRRSRSFRSPRSGRRWSPERIWIVRPAFGPSGSTSLSSTDATTGCAARRRRSSRQTPPGRRFVIVTLIGTEAVRPPGSRTIVVHDERSDRCADAAVGSRSRFGSVVTHDGAPVLLSIVERLRVGGDVAHRYLDAPRRGRS